MISFCAISIWLCALLICLRSFLIWLCVLLSFNLTVRFVYVLFLSALYIRCLRVLPICALFMRSLYLLFTHALYTLAFCLRSFYLLFMCTVYMCSFYALFMWILCIPLWCDHDQLLQPFSKKCSIYLTSVTSVLTMQHHVKVCNKYLKKWLGD